MTKAHKPRSGSLAFYPRKRAKKETPSFRAYKRVAAEGAAAKALSFLAYKAGMLHLAGKESYQKATVYGQNISVPATVLECPPLKVFGVRAYTNARYGIRALCEVTSEKTDKHLARRVKTLGKKRKAKKEGMGGEKKAAAKDEKRMAFEDMEKMKGNISEARLLVHTQPALTGIGKKKPDVGEISLSGSVDEQLAYAKKKLGSELHIGEVFREKQFVDVRAVDKGKGFSGVVKRFGVKMHRPKAKKRRVVGSIGPWHPPTVMFTVARAGQLGYQTRTEFNKKLISIGEDFDAINPASGFQNYGLLRNEYALVSGSVPGPAKRVIGLRDSVRPPRAPRSELAAIEFISSSAGKAETKGGKGIGVGVAAEEIAKVAEAKPGKKEGGAAEEIAKAAEKAEKKQEAAAGKGKKEGGALAVQAAEAKSGKKESGAVHGKKESGAVQAKKEAGKARGAKK